MPEENMVDPPVTTLAIKRRVYTHEAFNETYLDEANTLTIKDRIKEECQCTGPRIGRIALSFLPIVKAVRKYKIKEYIIGDVLSGLTASFMHLPQAMGFGILAGLQPLHGMYTTFFPVLVYMIFGTSPYISFGTNAIMALLTQTVVDREADTFIASFSGANTTMPSDEEIMGVKERASMACCVLVGVILMTMGLLKMGIITTYLSTSFIGGFTASAAVHIFTSQLPKLLGLKVKAIAGAGKLVLTYIDIFSKIDQTVVAEVIISVVSIIILLLVKICINERFKDKLKMPVPIDLLICVAATIISHFAKFGDNFGVTIVGTIPSGFIPPGMPSFENAGSFASDAFVMAILSLAMSISLAKLLASKHGQPIDANQELFSYGACNLISGFFFSFPSASAPPRTMILTSLGARTTLNAVATLGFFLLVILVIGQLFVSLPLSVLAAMIIVSIKDLLLQYRNLPNIWKVNKYDFVIWVVTNVVGVFADLNYGIFAGVGISILLTVVRHQLSTGHLISLSSTEDVLLNDCIPGKNKQLEGIAIFKIPTDIYFATAERLKVQLFQNVVDPDKQLKMIAKEAAVDHKMDLDEIKVTAYVENGHASENGTQRDGMSASIRSNSLKFLVLDCSIVTYIDMAGIAALQQIIKGYKKIDVDIFMAGLPKNVVATMEAANFFDTYPKKYLFMGVFDVLSALNMNSCIGANKADSTTVI
ncbi:Cadherin EGF LAG seven-pass G-type receptor 3 [Mactra antiquata]